MVTIGDFVAGELLEVVGGQSAPLDSRLMEVGQVSPCGAGWRLPHGDGPRRSFLALVPADEAPEDMGAALRDLARQGAVAVSVTGKTDGLDLAALAAAGAGAGLVVLAGPGSSSPAQLMGRLMHRQTEVYRQRTEIATQIFRLTSELYRKGEGPGRLLAFIARQTGTRIDLISPGDPTWEEMHDADPYLEQLADGAIATKSYFTSTPPTASDAALVRGACEWHVSLHALHGQRPHPVLLARAPGRLSPHTLDLIDQTAVQAAMLFEPLRRRALTAAADETRTAVLQYLMMGEVTTATRVAERLAPGVLTAEAGRVAIVECTPSEDRSAASEAVAGALTPVLIAPCPAYDRHLILAFPDDGDRYQALQRLTEEGRVVGVSAPRPWPRTVLSYQAAFHALSTAREAPGRIAIDGGEPVAALLPPAARAWGRAMEARLEALPADQRAITVHTAQIALAHGDAKAAKLLGVPRTTAGSRLEEVMSAMGLSRGSLIHRAVADLALQLASLPADEEPTPPPALAALLTSDSAATPWAKQFLDPLNEEQLRVLTAWLAADGHVTATAEALGSGRNSISRWLTQASARLSRALRDPGEGPHDPLWALLLTGRLDPQLLPETATV